MTPLSPTSLDITQDSIEQLKALFPNVFTEGKIDFDALKDELGDFWVKQLTGKENLLEKLKTELSEHLAQENERYQFTWNGKAQAKRIATTPSMGTLRPAVDESVNWDTTENLYIEGDNLEVLKLLQKAYFGKVKMIYIDPPYNTGKDFVYKDDFKDNLSNYKRLTNQVDEQGNPLTTNSDSSGRYHSNWLNMMYPRLKLARNLLRDDGVIFISIDDNEVHNLRKLCDEIFGEGNFVANVVWQKKYAATNDAKGFSAMHDHIIVYQKSANFERKLLPRTEEQNKPYKNDDGDGKGLWRSDNLLVRSFSSNAVYPIKNPNTGEDFYPSEGSSWRASKETMAIWLAENRIYWGKDGTGAPQLKRYLNEVQDGRVPTTWWKFEEVGHNDAANKEVAALFESKTPFDTPKPSTLINQMLQIASDKNDIILDFFSGSATTAHAVMQLNADDGGKRKFILVQIPEATPEGSEARKAGYATIAEIGKERIRRAGKKIQDTLTPTLSQGERELDFGAEKPAVDLGFKVFKLDTSNIKAWNPTPETLQDDLLNAVDNILVGRTDEDLLYEVLIKYGLPLTLPVEKVPLGQQTGFSVGMGSLIACFAQGITLETVQTIADMSTPENPVLRVVFRDSSFADDNVKTNAVQRLKQAGIEDVVSV